MKTLLHNINILAMLVLTLACLHSCSDVLHDEEDVQVNFTATLPVEVGTRSFGKAEQVNTLVVGIFKKGGTDVYAYNGNSNNYYEIGRQSFKINGTSADVQLELAKGQTYSFIFWAYDSSKKNYNIDNLTSITMEMEKDENDMPLPVTFGQMESFDAFFATKEDITITGNSSYLVELVRPLAQINVGTTGTPVPAIFTVKSVPDTFSPFSNTVSGSTACTWNFSETTAETFSADGKQYNYLVMGYMFAPAASTKISAELTLTDGGNSKTLEFSQVEIKANNRSNIAGSFTATK